MTPEEEKAKELIEKFKKYSEHDWLAAGYSEYKPVEEVILLQAKQCALICVEVMMEFLNAMNVATSIDIGRGYMDDDIKEWQQVKSIIEKP